MVGETAVYQPHTFVVGTVVMIRGKNSCRVEVGGGPAVNSPKIYGYQTQKIAQATA